MPKSVEYYLSKGFDKRTAEYFAAGRRKICSVKVGEARKLFITFDNFERKVFDVNELIEPNTVFAHLEDKSIFERVYIDDCGCVAWDIDPNKDSNVHWSNKIDLSPDTCYLDSVDL